MQERDMGRCEHNCVLVYHRVVVVAFCWTIFLILWIVSFPESIFCKKVLCVPGVLRCVTHKTHGIRI